MKFEVSFSGGMKVDARFGNHTIRTDQPLQAGGTDTAPAPFDLFLGSIATCAGFYAMRFCQQRDIPTNGLNVTLDPIRDEEHHRVGTIRLEVTLPQGFPEKYRDAILRSIDQCAVKRHIIDPPKFEIAVGETVLAE